MRKKIIRIGSRESRLAVCQSRIVMERIQRACPELSVELVTMKTTGDKILDRSLDQIGGKGLFVKELDLALLEGRIDLAVHSLKDMPMETDERLPILAYSKREDPRDALVLPNGAGELELSVPVGCGSRRRCLQLQRLIPGVCLKGIRGNVETRLARVDSGEFSATVLAMAGLNRLGLSARASRIFEPEEMIPSAGQGVLAVQGRAGEDTSYLDCIRDRESQVCSIAERSFVKALDGGCTSPIAAYARIEGQRLILTGFYADEKEHGVRASLEGAAHEPESLGVRLAVQIKRMMENG